jgi:cell division protein FtsZ
MQRRSQTHCQARIRVVGVGSGGITAINRLVGSGIYGVDFITVDADDEAERESRAPAHINIGDASSGKWGLSGNVEGGMLAAQGAGELLSNALSGSDLVIIIAGLGGGTGTGAAPIVAELAKKEEAVVFCIVTYPFSFEGETRIASADLGIARLKDCTDTLIVVPNDRILRMAGGTIGFHETYRLAHDIWQRSVEGISDLVNRSGLINVDFADVRAILSEGGGAVIATGRGTGPSRARDAALRATRSDLLGITIDQATGLLFNVVGGTDLSLLEVEEAASILTRRAQPEANVIIGASVNAALTDEIRITVVATGFDASLFNSEVSDRQREVQQQRRASAQTPVFASH